MFVYIGIHAGKENLCTSSSLPSIITPNDTLESSQNLCANAPSLGCVTAWQKLSPSGLELIKFDTFGYNLSKGVVKGF